MFMWFFCPDYMVIQNMLQNTLQQNFQVAKAPAHASYIPAEIWDIRQAKMSLKRASRGRARLWPDLIPWAFRQWKEGIDRGLLRLVGKQGFLYNLAAATTRFAAARVRKGIAIARQSFLNKILAGGHQSAAQVLRRAKAAGLGGARARRPGRPLPALLNPANGLPVGDKAGYDQVWLEHFGQQEQGHIVATDQLIQQAAMPTPADEVVWQLDFLPCQAEVESILRAVPRGKAAGLDNISGEVLNAGFSPLAPILHALFTKAILWAKQPTQFRGGVLYESATRTLEAARMLPTSAVYLSAALSGSSITAWSRTRCRARRSVPCTPCIVGPGRKLRCFSLNYTS